MIIDAPHSIARAYLGMRELETFIPRYVEVVMKTVAEMHNSAERLKIDDKESRDAVLGQLLTTVNTFILGEDETNVKQWPLVTLTPVHVGLAFRSQLLRLLTATEVDIRAILNFINVVYFPALNLAQLNESILNYGERPAPNSAATQKMMLLLIHQVAMLSSRGELVLDEGGLVDDADETVEVDDEEGEA